MQNAERLGRNMESGKRKASRRCLFLLSAYCLLLSIPGRAQQPSPSGPTSPVNQEEEGSLPADWAPQLLDAILSSSNPAAQDALHRAAFAAGPAIVPQLEAALKDDRTAEFAAQSLAFIGGDKALEILWKLVSDPRDLNLRRFYYGALGEFDAPQARQTLLDVINRADAEPDRTVTEAAILALTVRSDANLVPPLRQAEAKIKDVVIRDDLDNALAVIESRARYLATPEGKNAGSSLERGVRTYFIPALEPPSTPTAPSKPPVRGAAPAKSAARQPTTPKPPVTVEIQHLTFSPDKSRALARVLFEDPSALASYDMVLQKQYGNWVVASVWLGAEVEKAAPSSRPAATPPE